MNRLIKKDKYGYGPINFMDVCDKLYALEDIEEELGIDLITLFKALTNGYYTELNCYISNLRLTLFNGDFCLYEDDGDDYCNMVKLKDYQKTWWLKEERSE